MALQIIPALRAHPAKGELAMRSIPASAAARELNYSEQYFRRVINGKAMASARFRNSLSTLLGMAASELFSNDTPCG